MAETNNEQKKYSFRPYNLVGHYDFLTPDTKLTYTPDKIREIDSESGFDGLAAKKALELQSDERSVRSALFAERRDLYREIVAMEYLASVSGGLDKVSGINSRTDLVSKFDELPGAKYDTPVSDPKTGNYWGTTPGINGKALSYSYVTSGQRKFLENNVARSEKYRYNALDKKYNYIDESKKLLAQKYIKVAEYNALMKKMDEGRQILGLCRAIGPYTTYDERKDILVSGDVLKNMLDKAKLFYKEVNPNFIDKENGKNYKEVRCVDGFANLAQTNQLANAYRAKMLDSLKEEYTKANNGNDITIEQAKEMMGRLNNLVDLEKVRISREMSYYQAADAIGHLPISQTQKFNLNKMLGVSEEKTNGLNRIEASAMIKEVSSKIAGAEVGPKLRAYAERFNLVQPGESYTNAQWMDDSKKKNIPPMPEFKEMVEKLGLSEVLKERGEYFKRTPNHNDCVAVLTDYFNKADEKMNGPVEQYQVNAVPQAGLCKTWQEAEGLYLQHCVVSNLIGDAEAKYVATSVKMIPGCHIDQILNPELSADERKKMAESTREAIDKAMIADRVEEVRRARVPKDNVFQNVKVAINHICEGISTNDGFVAATKGKNAAILNEYKKIVGENKPVGLGDAQLVTRAIMSFSPGMVGEPGSYKERYNAVYKEVKEILKPVNLNQAKKEQKVEDKEKEEARVKKITKAQPKPPKVDRSGWDGR